MKHIIRTRRAGTIYILISIVLGVVAVNSSNNLLYLATAVMLGYMLASGIAGRHNIRNASVSVSASDEIYAQVPCAVTVSAANQNRLAPIFLIEVTLSWVHGERRVLFPVLQPGQTESKTLFISFPSRGRHVIKAGELSSVYPFNFFVRYWPVDAKAAATVFPCPLRCDADLTFTPDAPQDHRDDTEAAEPLPETDIVGVRPYAEGDSMKHVHWKSSARTGKLKTRLYDAAFSRSSSRRARVIDLDRLVAGGVERGLSMASYAITESMKSKLPIGLQSRGEVIFPASGRAHKKNLLTKLALYDE